MVEHLAHSNADIGGCRERLGQTSNGPCHATGSAHTALTFFRAILLISVLASFFSTLLLVASHLFYGQTYIHDTGYWIGLSTGTSPTQLLEPSGINAGSYSYFNTHYSPIFSALQILYTPLRSWLPPPSFFLLWFMGFNLLNSCLFAGALMLPIERVLPVSWHQQRMLSLLMGTALVSCSWLATGSASYIISYITYPHTEIIGLQLSYIGLFLLVVPRALRSLRPPPTTTAWKTATTAGLFLIVLGSLFHELVAAICIYNLVIFRLSISRRTNTSEGSRQWVTRAVMLTIGIISVPLLGWLILRQFGQFPGTAVSALQRIYMGSHFDHLSLGRHLAMLREACNSNKIATLTLALAMGMSFHLLRRGYRDYVLYLLVPVVYLIASPIALEENAATLKAHYGYPLQSVFYLFAIGLAITWSSSLNDPAHTSRRAPQIVHAIPAIGSVLLAGASMISLFNRQLNAPHACTERTIAQRFQNDTCIHRTPVAKVWFNPYFVISYIGLGSRIIRRAESTFSRQDFRQGKLTTVMSDHSLVALFPNRFLWENVLAQDQIPLYLQGKLKLPKNRVFIRYHIEDGLWNEDVLNFIKHQQFRLVSKHKVGSFGTGNVYEYVWSNADAQTAASGPKQ